MKLVKVGAVWCPSCHVMKSKWEEIEKEYPSLTSEYFDYDENEDMLINHYKIKDTLPVTIFVDKDGNELDRLVGIVTKKEIISLIEVYNEK